MNWKNDPKAAVMGQHDIQELILKFSGEIWE
jgi:hypothetical protein